MMSNTVNSEERWAETARVLAGAEAARVAEVVAPWYAQARAADEVAVAAQQAASRTAAEAEAISEPRLPRQIRAGAHWYEVERSIEPDGGGRWAETIFIQRKIRFSPLCDARNVPEVLLHELIHIVAEDRALEELQGDGKERIIKTLGNGLAAVLQDLGFLPTRLKLAEDA